MLTLSTNPGGTVDVPAVLPTLLPPGFTFVLQLRLADAGARARRDGAR
jgi:hypothetical protein